MKKRVSRFLTRYFFRLRLFHILIIFIVSTSIIFLYLRIKNLDNFINNYLTTRTEWSPSEHSSFLSIFIAELNRHTGEDKKEQARQYENIKKLLMDMKGNIEEKNLEEKIKDLELNLVLDEISETDIKGNIIFKRPVLRSDDKMNIPKSFVFLPTQLVNLDENKLPILPVNLKRELVSSKILEKYLEKIIEKIPRASHSYYISVNGFIRIFAKTNNPVERYKDKFSYGQNFADRTYFDLTLKRTFHQSPPYVDTGGFGIVQTYSVAIINQDLGIIGIIAVDIPIMESLERLLEKSPPGPTIHFFKNFLIDFCDLKSIPTRLNTYHNYLKDKEKSQLIQFIKDNPGKTLTTVQRFDFNAEGNLIQINSDSESRRTIFSAPIKKNRVAFVIFDKNRLVRNNLLFIFIIALLLITITGFIRYVYYQNLKGMKAEENQLRLISHMHSSYVITDKDNSILDYNEEFECLVEENNLGGKNFENYLTEDSLKDFRYHMDAKKERFECPIEIKGPRGTRKPAILINTETEYPFAKDSRISIIIESENLESMVAEKYLDRISHVLKTPLHSILLIADRLRRKSARPLYDDYFTLLNTSITELGDAISKLLMISRIEYKLLRPMYEKFNLSRLCNEISREFQRLAKNKKLEFFCNLAQRVTILGDKNMIKVVVENILDNALKYTIQGSISLSLFDDVANAKIVIEDTGIGIPDDEHELIFKKKYRGDHPLVKQNDGHGIGLYQSMQFIKHNGGKIHVHSVPEVGSKFTIILPKKDKS